MQSFGGKLMYIDSFARLLGYDQRFIESIGLEYLAYNIFTGCVAAAQAFGDDQISMHAAT